MLHFHGHVSYRVAQFSALSAFSFIIVILSEFTSLDTYNEPNTATGRKRPQRFKKFSGGSTRVLSRVGAFYFDPGPKKLRITYISREPMVHGLPQWVFSSPQIGLGVLHTFRVFFISIHHNLSCITKTLFLLRAKHNAPTRFCFLWFDFYNGAMNRDLIL